MTTQEKEKIRKTALSEANRYRDNANQNFEKAKIDDATHSYIDVKYVKTAYGILYSGALVILDAYIRLKGKKKAANRKTIDYYRETVKDDKTMLKFLNMIYDSAHLAGYYDGNLSVGLKKDTFSVYENFVRYFKNVTL